MELTKGQVKNIDIRLKNSGVKYWDIRIELLDHIVLDVEKRLSEGENFEKAVSESMIRMGYHLRFKKFIENKSKEVSSKFNKLYQQEIIRFFQSGSKILSLVVAVLLYFAVFKLLPFITFKIVSFMFFGIPTIVSAINYIKYYKRKNRSMYLEQSQFFITSSTVSLYAIFQMLTIDVFNISITAQAIILFIITSLNFLLFYCGYQVYINTRDKYVKIYQQLQSL